MHIDLNTISDWITVLTPILTVIGASYVALRKVVRDNQKTKKHHEEKIAALETNLALLKDNVDKDIAHLKESYKSEIKFLGEKIQELRQEVHDQHGQLLAILMKLIGKD